MMKEQKSSVLIIYTGGTIGMSKDHDTGLLVPIDFSNILREVPELQRFNFNIDCETIEPIKDSSNYTIVDWQILAQTIAKNYNNYDGFVILHGTDTMSFTASAVSFMLNNLAKPVVFTGSQVPIGMLRTDGKENLITAIEIAAQKHKGRAMVPEVCLYFENSLFRGNRTTKHRSEFFNAFSSHNYPALAEAGIQIKYNKKFIRRVDDSMPLELRTKIDNHVGLLKLFPGMEHSAKSILGNPNIKAVIIETYGAGNAPSFPWFIDILKEAQERGVILMNVSQCPSGSVDMSIYETSSSLLKIGVVNGRDITSEAALAKMMLLLGEYPKDRDAVIQGLNTSLQGEMTCI